MLPSINAVCGKRCEVEKNEGANLIIYSLRSLRKSFAPFAVKKITGKIEPYTVEIFNAMGVLIGSVSCNEEAVHINQSDLPTGIYYIKMTITKK
jgi:hypothetical protein